MKGMQLFLLYAAAALLFAGVSVVYADFFRRYAAKKTGADCPARAGKRWYIKFCVCFAAVYLAAAGMVFYFLRESLVISQARWLLMLFCLFLAAALDFKLKLIPPHVLWVMLLARVVFLIFEYGQAGEMASYLITSVVVGTIVGGGVMLLVYAISRGGLGFGDVKLFAVLGFYLGLSSTMQLFIYTFLLSAICSLCLLALKKAKLKDQVPIAPFAFLGAALTCIFL